MPLLGCAILLVGLTCARLISAQTPCNIGQLLVGEDLPGQPVPIPAGHKADGQDCALMCMGNLQCRGFNWASEGQCGPVTCNSPSGCCWLKTGASLTSLNTTAVGNCGCSIMMRADPSSLPPAPVPAPSPPPGAKNVLYVLVDDLRPELTPYGQGFMATPHIQGLAQAGTVFNRAYCNIAVCSPSRISFLTGRYPHHTGVWNFLNHFRQANCREVPGMGIVDPPSMYKEFPVPNGGAGQCCTTCTEEGSVCKGWSLLGGVCRLHNAAVAPVPVNNSVTGVPGSTTSRGWVTLPQHFREAGYLTLSSGKIFHSEEGGSGPPPWDGVSTGMPPLQDPPSWSTQGQYNTSMANVNSIVPMRPCDPSESLGGNPCSVNASLAGDVPPGVYRFSDRLTADDAVAKLTYAAQNYKDTGQPFFMAVGFRKPHLPFRHPAPYDALYPSPDTIPLAKYKTLDPSVPLIAYHTTDPDGLAKSPFTPLPDEQAGVLRRDYYAAVSWMDSQVGRVLDALSSSGLSRDTAIAFHGDHGWSLGEYGEWEKFNNWEYGTRVPLIISAPWISNSSGSRSDTIAQLIDVYPTLADLAGIPVPGGYGLDGASLVPAMVQAGAGAGAAAETAAPTASRTPAQSPYALSVYPRCPYDLANASSYWHNGDCLYVERSTFPIMGVTLRVEDWRYTEWLWWNGTSQSPLFSSPAVGVELYSHAGDIGDSFDGPYEVVNLAGQGQYAAIQAQLAAQLRVVYPYHG